MASPTDSAGRLGAEWRYVPRTRGYHNVATGQTLSRRQYDKLYGSLARSGYRSYEEKAAARERQGSAPGPARGRYKRTMQVAYYDNTQPLGMTLAPVPLDKRTASRMGRYWNAFGEAQRPFIGSPDAFKARYDRRRIWDSSRRHSYALVGDLNLLMRYFDSLTHEEQSELWEQLYRRGLGYAT